MSVDMVHHHWGLRDQTSWFMKLELTALRECSDIYDLNNYIVDRNQNVFTDGLSLCIAVCELFSGPYQGV